MKKVLLTLLAVFMAVPAFAIEVYNNGDNSVAIYGHIRGYLGYGMGHKPNVDVTGPGISTPTGEDKKNHNFLYGLQDNTRIGTNIKIGNFSGQIELGANEKTMYKETTKDTVGFRQAWGAYTFGNGSKLLFGKTDTPTAMGGFNSDIYQTDGGLNGFGGTATGSRRFQIQYSIAGLTLALIEDDMKDGMSMDGFTDNAPYTPRAGISYTFKNDNLLVKLAATYTAVNGSYHKTGDTTGKLSWTNLHAGGVTLGVKPQFGNMWVGFVARYGVNEDLYGEAKTLAFNQTGYGHNGYQLSIPGVKNKPFDRTFNAEDGSFNNTHRAGAAIEFGMKATENFTAILGAGYQATIQEMKEIVDIYLFQVHSPSYLVHSYAVFLQGQYAFSPNFALVPQIAWYGTVGKASGTIGTNKYEVSDSQNGLLVGAQFRVTF